MTSWILSLEKFHELKLNKYVHPSTREFQKSLFLMKTTNYNKHYYVIRFDFLKVYNTKCLKLNTSKTVEMIIYKPRFNVIDFPSPLPGILRLNQAKILEVTITDTLSFDEHVNTVVTRV